MEVPLGRTLRKVEARAQQRQSAMHERRMGRLLQSSEAPPAKALPAAPDQQVKKKPSPYARMQRKKDAASERRMSHLGSVPRPVPYEFQVSMSAALGAIRSDEFTAAEGAEDGGDWRMGRVREMLGTWASGVLARHGVSVPTGVQPIEKIVYHASDATIITMADDVSLHNAIMHWCDGHPARAEEYLAKVAGRITHEALEMAANALWEFVLVPFHHAFLSDELLASLVAACQRASSGNAKVHRSCIAAAWWICEVNRLTGADFDSRERLLRASVVRALCNGGHVVHGSPANAFLAQFMGAFIANIKMHVIDRDAKHDQDGNYQDRTVVGTEVLEWSEASSDGMVLVLLNLLDEGHEEAGGALRNLILVDRQFPERRIVPAALFAMTETTAAESAEPETAFHLLLRLVDSGSERVQSHAVSIASTLLCEYVASDHDEAVAFLRRMCTPKLFAEVQRCGARALPGMISLTAEADETVGNCIVLLWLMSLALPKLSTEPLPPGSFVSLTREQLVAFFALRDRGMLECDPNARRSLDGVVPTHIDTMLHKQQKGTNIGAALHAKHGVYPTPGGIPGEVTRTPNCRSDAPLFRDTVAFVMGAFRASFEVPNSALLRRSSAATLATLCQRSPGFAMCFVLSGSGDAGQSAMELLIDMMQSDDEHTRCCAHQAVAGAAAGAPALAPLFVAWGLHQIALRSAESAAAGSGEAIAAAAVVMTLVSGVESVPVEVAEALGDSFLAPPPPPSSTADAGPSSPHRRHPMRVKAKAAATADDDAGSARAADGPPSPGALKTSAVSSIVLAHASKLRVIVARHKELQRTVLHTLEPSPDGIGRVLALLRKSYSASLIPHMCVVLWVLCRDPANVEWLVDNGAMDVLLGWTAAATLYDSGDHARLETFEQLFKQYVAETGASEKDAVPVDMPMHHVRLDLSACSPCTRGGSGLHRLQEWLLFPLREMVRSSQRLRKSMVHLGGVELLVDLVMFAHPRYRTVRELALGTLVEATHDIPRNLHTAVRKGVLPALLSAIADRDPPDAVARREPGVPGTFDEPEWAMSPCARLLAAQYFQSTYNSDELQGADDSAEHIFKVVPESVEGAMLTMVKSRPPEVNGYGALSIASLTHRSQIQKQRAANLGAVAALVAVLNGSIINGAGGGDMSGAEIPEVSAPTATTRNALHALLNLSVLKAAQSTIVNSGLRVVLAFARSPIRSELEESVHRFASGVLRNCGENADITTQLYKVQLLTQSTELRVVAEARASAATGRLPRLPFTGGGIHLDYSKSGRKPRPKTAQASSKGRRVERQQISTLRTDLAKPIYGMWKNTERKCGEAQQATADAKVRSPWDLGEQVASTLHLHKPNCRNPSAMAKEAAEREKKVRSRQVLHHVKKSLVPGQPSTVVDMGSVARFVHIPGAHVCRGIYDHYLADDGETTMHVFHHEGARELAAALPKLCTSSDCHCPAANRMCPARNSAPFPVPPKLLLVRPPTTDDCPAFQGRGAPLPPPPDFEPIVGKWCGAHGHCNVNRAMPVVLKGQPPPRRVRKIKLPTPPPTPRPSEPEEEEAAVVEKEAPPVVVEKVKIANWTLETHTGVWNPRLKRSEARDFYHTEKLQLKTVALDWKRMVQKPAVLKAITAKHLYPPAEAPDMLEKMRLLVFANAQLISDVFDFYSGIGGSVDGKTSMEMNLNAYQQLLVDLTIAEKGSKFVNQSALDTIHIVTNLEHDKKSEESKIVPDRSFVRFQFIEGLLRIAVAKFSNKDLPKEQQLLPDVALQTLLTLISEKANVLALMPGNLFRRNRLYDQDVDDLLISYLPTLQAIYDRYSPKTANSPGGMMRKRKEMWLPQWLALMADAEFITEEFTKRECLLCGIFSRARFSDELLKRIEHCTLVFTDFLEALCRAADWMMIPTDDEIQGFMGCRDVTEFFDNWIMGESTDAQGDIYECETAPEPNEFDKMDRTLFEKMQKFLPLLITRLSVTGLTGQSTLKKLDGNDPFMKLMRATRDGYRASVGWRGFGLSDSVSADA